MKECFFVGSPDALLRFSERRLIDDYAVYLITDPNQFYGRSLRDKLVVIDPSFTGDVATLLLIINRMNMHIVYNGSLLGWRLWWRAFRRRYQIAHNSSRLYLEMTKEEDMTFEPASMFRMLDES